MQSAVIATGGKQYLVTKGSLLKIEKLEYQEGDQVIFDRVLLLKDASTTTVGSPFVDGAKVTAEVRQQGRGKKVSIVKFKRRKHYERHIGHRQYFTEVSITDIISSDSSGGK